MRWGRLQPARDFSPAADGRSEVRCRLTLALSLIALCGCGASSQRRAFEYMPDMVRDPAYKAFAPNAATRDGLTLQNPVAGTIARGYQPFHYGPGEDEAQRAGSELKNPYPATAQTIQEGKALYETYCLVCHGESGKGDGSIADKIPHPPSYVSDRVLQFQPGRIFHVITMGTTKMPSYAAQLSAAERWKVVAYVRTSLQGIREEQAAERHRAGAALAESRNSAPSAAPGSVVPRASGERPGSQP